MKLILIWLVSVLLQTSNASTTLGSLSNRQVDIIQFAYNQAFDKKIDPDKFLKLMACESQINEKARGDWSIEEQQHKANGILQFWQKTFLTQADEYNFDGDYKNPYDQIELASMMIRDGKIKHWFNCAKASGYKF